MVEGETAPYAPRIPLMFYSRQEPGPSLLRFLVMFVVAFGCSIYFFLTDVDYDRVGVMLAAAGLCGGYFLWQTRQFESAEAVMEEMMRSLREVWS